MKETRKTYRFTFSATLGTFLLNATNISSPLVATWKRSSEIVSTSPVDMVGGKADFNQTLSLRVNMYFDDTTQRFQQKKTLLTFTMATPKGQKQAGVVHLQVAEMLNNKLTQFQNTYMLEKCPVKNSNVQIKITAQLIGQGNVSDTMSVDSTILSQSTQLSTLSLSSKQSVLQINQQPQVKQQIVSSNKQNNDTDISRKLEEKDKVISQLQKEIEKLKKQKESMSTQIKKMASSKDQNKDASQLTSQLRQSKQKQTVLERQIEVLRAGNIDHERDLQKMRVRMQQIYQLLFTSLNSVY